MSRAGMISTVAPSISAAVSVEQSMSTDSRNGGAWSGSEKNCGQMISQRSRNSSAVASRARRRAAISSTRDTSASVKPRR
jgi:hypothetical protein